MTENEFKRLLIDTVRVQDYEKKDELLSLLRFVTIRYEKTSQFTRHVWNHCEEYIYICIVPDKLNELKSHGEYIESVCYKIYEPNDYYELWGVEIRPGTLPNDEDVSQEIIFENIRSQIIDEIRDAKYMIWVAMAWFTDPVLFGELKKKKSQGIAIEIALDNNDKNHSAEFNVESEFPIYWITIESQYTNLMHEKFWECPLEGFYGIIEPIQK